MTQPSHPSSLSLNSQPPPNSGSPATDWLDIGRIVAAQGLQGEVRVHPDSDFSERFEQPGQRWVQMPGQPQPQPLQLQRGRFMASKGLYIVKFAGIDSRDQADALRGGKLMVPASERPKLAPGEFYLQDLIGLTVINQQTQTVIGQVTGIVYAGNTLLEIKNGPQKYLVPFVEALVPIVDLERHHIEVNPIPGLLPNEV